jgi:hypothetical protein
MKNRIILILFGALLAIIAVSCAVNQISWSIKENTFDPTREVVGLPSIAIGNLSPSARVPGLELLCTGLYDAPGGYCGYFTDGVPFIGFPTGGNITVSDINK